MSDLTTLGLINTYAQRLEGLYIPMRPQGFPAPEVVELNDALLAELGLDSALIRSRAAAIFSGSEVPADAAPLAQAYAGHQFGGFSPQLGDGRAVLLGEILDRRGVLRDLQLKGSGPTRFSRGGDGKATLGPILREHVVSEAMHHLGVPTTRVLAALTTGETVWRSEPLAGAVLARVAASHVRVGTLQYFAVRREQEKLERLVAYSLERHYPDQVGSETPALALLRAAGEAQARLVADWMRVGFIHGVMNTDNTTLSGETIDYGPCAFLDTYDPRAVFSSIDRAGRYSFGNQPGIAQWNLARMGEALLTLLSADQGDAIAMVEAELERYAESFRAAHLDNMRAKLGLQGAEVTDAALIDDLHRWMHRSEQDFTLTFRRLAESLRPGPDELVGPEYDAWRRRWVARHGGEEPTSVAARMDSVNPVYIPRNHLVEEALDAAIAGDLAPFRTLLEVLRSPCVVQPGRERYAESAPDGFGPYATFCGT